MRREGLPFHIWLASAACEILDVTFAMNLGWAKTREECAALIVYQSAHRHSKRKPARQEATSKSGQHGSHLSLAYGIAPPWRGEARVLVVEDNVSVRQATCMLLELQGYRVTPAASLSEAL